MELYLLLFLLVFLINLVPAFMPPTWTIISFFTIKYDLFIFPTVLLAVVAATGGRVILALAARRWFRRFLPKKYLENYEHLGEALEQHQKLTIPVVLAYAFSPISSNSLFIIAGLSNVDLKIITFSFFVGRLFSYTFWVSASSHLSDKLEDIFAGSLHNHGAIISALFSLLIVIIIGKINWKKILTRKM